MFNKNENEQHAYEPAATYREQIFTNLFRALSHDMRIPLANIMGNSLTLQENWTLLHDPEKAESIAQIYEDSERLFNMVENLLALARVNDGDADLHTNDELVEEVIGEALQKIEKHHPGHTFHVTAPKAYIFLPMDALLIEQVIMNLLENALSRSDSPKPVDILIEDYPDTVSFTIRDYGDRIPKGCLANLFDASAYTSSHTTDIHKRFSLNLITCKMIIDAHQGILKAQNRNNGAAFIFTLPKSKRKLHEE